VAKADVEVSINRLESSNFSSGTEPGMW